MDVCADHGRHNLTMLLSVPEYLEKLPSDTREIVLHRHCSVPSYVLPSHLFGKFVQLQRLDCSGFPFVALLGLSPTLTHLKCSFTYIRFLPWLPSLRSLDCHCTPLQHLHYYSTLEELTTVGTPLRSVTVPDHCQTCVSQHCAVHRDRPVEEADAWFQHILAVVA